MAMIGIVPTVLRAEPQPRYDLTAKCPGLAAMDVGVSRRWSLAARARTDTTRLLVVVGHGIACLLCRRVSQAAETTWSPCVGIWRGVCVRVRVGWLAARLRVGGARHRLQASNKVEAQAGAGRPRGGQARVGGRTRDAREGPAP